MPLSYSFLRNTLGALDALCGSFVSLQTPSYTEDPNTLITGTGVFAAEEWTATRKRGAGIFGTDGSQYDSNTLYLRHVFGVEGINIIGAIALAKSFNFKNYSSILEIGCGDMAQALVLHHLFPHIRYTATDLDPYIIERCSKLTLLDGVHKRVLNVLQVNDESAYEGVDLLMSWGVEYALDDAQLRQLLGVVRNRNLPYLMCSSTTIGPFKYLVHIVNRRRADSLVAEGRLRMQGWNRSVGSFRRMAREAELNVRLLGRFGYFSCLLIEPWNRHQ